MSVLTRARTVVLLTLIPAVTVVGLHPPTANAAQPIPSSSLGAPAAQSAAAPKILNVAAPAQTTTTTPTTPTATTNANASYTVSKAVYSFLTGSLGVTAGSSATLTGTAAGGKITIGVGAPTAIPLTLPAGITAATFGPSTIVIDTAANTVTLTSSATGTTGGSLKVVISNAATSTLPAADLAATLSVSFSIFGAPVTLTGALTFASGKAQSALSGSLSSDASLGSVVLAKGSSLKYPTTGGLTLAGNAIIAAGTGVARSVAVSGPIASSTTWSLAISAGAQTTWTPESGLTVTPGFSGTITDAAGTVRFDATATTSGTWSAVPGETVSVAKVELANTTAPAGAPSSLSDGKVWVAVTGNFAGPASATGTATAVTDVATSTTTLNSVQSGTITLASTPQAVTLSALKLTGSLSGPSTGAAQVTIGTGASAAITQATVVLTPQGQLLVSFPTDLSRVGLGAIGMTGTAYWASAPIGAFADPASGKTVALPAGYSLIAGNGTVSTPAQLPVISNTLISKATAVAPAAAIGANSYPISAAAQQFLSKLGVAVGSTLSGASNGTTLTVTAPAPSTLPFTLPTGDAVTFGATTITVDLSAGTLTAAATATSTNGAAGTLMITIANVSTTTLGADLTATLDLTGLPVLGTTVELTGTLAYSSGAVSASLTGTLSADAVVSSLLTIQAGSMITLSTANGLAVSGTAVVGTGTSTFTVAVTGGLKDLHNWSVSVSTDAAATTFTPVDRLTIKPNFSGTISDTDGTVTFDVTATDPVSWDAGGSVMLALNHVEISNDATPAGVNCPAVNAGDIWLDVQGSMRYDNAGITAGAEACIDVPARTFVITGTETGAFGPSNGFTLSNANLTVAGDLKAKTANVSASALLTITAGNSHPQFPVGLSFDSTGGFVAGVGVDSTTLASIGVPGLSGELFVATKAVKGFDPSTLQIAGVQAFDLSSGVTVVTQYTPSTTVQAALAKFGLGQQSQLQLQANLSTTGFAMKIVLGFGATTNGAKLFSNSKATAYLNTVFLGFTAGTAGVSFTVGGTGYLALAPLYDGGTASAVAVTLSGSINLTPLKFSVSFDLAGACATPNASGLCPWTDAFGIKGLQVDEVSGSLGLDLTNPATPLPTMSFAVSNLVLPDAWGKAIGVSSGAQISLLFNFDVAQPELIFSIKGTTDNPVVLTPLSIASNNPDVVNQFQVKNIASLVFAPFGGKDVTNQPVTPGVSLIFDATIAGVDVHVDGAVSIAPPSFIANITVGDFHVGKVIIHNTMLAINLSSSGFSFAFSGGFTDTASNITFTAAVALNASATLAGGQIKLTMTGGLPSYISAGATLSATLAGTANSVSFTAYGTASLTVNGTPVGQVTASFSSDTGTLFQQLGADAAKVAAAFRQAYGWVDYQTISNLRSLQFSASQVAGGISSAYGEAAAAVMEAMGNAGYDLDTLIQGARTALGATDADVARAMQYFSYNAQQTAAEIASVYHEAAAAVMMAMGDAGYALDSLIQGARAALGATDADVAKAMQHFQYNAQQVAAKLAGVYNEGAAAVMQAMGNAGYNLDNLVWGARAALGATELDVIRAMQALRYTGPQIASEISRAFNDSATAVMEAFGNAGYSLDALIQAVRASIGATDTQVATAMRYFGYNAQQTASYLQAYFGDTQAQVYNALQAIGSGGQSALTAIAGFFNTGAYNIDTTFGLLLDVSGGSQSAGASVIDYTYNGGYSNQQWYVLRTDSGWAQLVNRNSGQCLDVTGDYNGASLIQNTCTGAASQQWYLGNNTAGGHVLTNRLSNIDNNYVNGRVMDIPGQTLARNTQIELYDYNGGFNQQWNFVPAIGG